MAAPDAFLQSLLEAAPGFGQPAALRAPTPGSTRGFNLGMDFSGAGGLAVPAAEKLLSPNAWDLLRHLAAEDADKVEVHYYVEKQGADLSSPNSRATQIVYPPVSARRRTALTRMGTDVGLEAYSNATARAALLKYATASNINVSPGIGAEHHHMHVLTMHKHVAALLTQMWLLHLDIANGADPVVTLDAVRVHSQLARVGRTEDECEAAKSLPGVRMHVNSCDQTLKALLVGACDITNVTSLSPRCSRFSWAPTPLTFYGGVLPSSQQVPLSNPDATARAIIYFGSRFATSLELSQALHTALLLYGMEDAGTRASLRAADPQLHEETHQMPVGTLGMTRVKELAGRELVALSMFLARAYAQSASQIVRSAVLAMGAKDVDGADAYLMNNQVLLMKGTGTTLGQNWQSLYPDILDHATSVHVGFKRHWSQKGVLHSLIAGITAEGSLADTMTQPLQLGTLLDTRVTDLPDAGDERKKETSRWLLLSEILRDGGENLCGSMDALRRGMGAQQRLHAETRLYSGSAIRFVIAGLGAPILTKLAQDPGLQLAPGIAEAAEEAAPVISHPEVVAEQLRAAVQSPRDEDWVHTLVTQRGPLASTVMRRAKPSQYARSPADTRRELVVVRMPDPATRAVARAAGLGWGPEETSGEGLLCGARALHQSLSAMAAVEGQSGPLLDQVRTALEHAMTPEQTALAEAAGVPLGVDNFTVDQLAIGLRQLGDYRLGILTSTNGTGDVMIHGEGDGEVVLIHHDGRNHWSSIGPSSNVRLRRQSTRSSPQ
jgi:hypothetical protein